MLDDARGVIDYLNQVTGKHFGYGEEHTALILARFKDGATVATCRQVIDQQVREWAGTPQAKYLRPATLFNKTKWGNYVGELGVSSSGVVGLTHRKACALCDELYEVAKGHTCPGANGSGGADGS